MEPDIRLTVRQAARREGIKNPSQLADKAGISRSMATAAWKDGKRRPELRTPDLRTLWKIARALNCDLGDLVQFAGTRRPASRNGKPKG